LFALKVMALLGFVPLLLADRLVVVVNFYLRGFMPIKKISLVYEGEDVLIDSAIQALAIQAGWTEESELPKEDFAKKLVNDFVREVVQNYNVVEAEKAAVAAAKAASLQALDSISVKLDVT
jgi:hypothetical protein